MDEYQLEIQSVRETLARLREQDAAAAVIEEYAAELRNLTALYKAASETFNAGSSDPRLAAALEHLGFGEWSLAGVYGFVYDMSMELDTTQQELAALIDQTDYAASLLEALEPEG